MRRMWIAAIALSALAACPGEDAPPACVTVDTACTPLYAPTTFTEVWTNTVRGTCGSSLAACHARGGAGKMSLESEAVAYQSLLEGHVTAGDPGCSEMIVRTSSVGKDYQMPPGPGLSEAERCALIQWVQMGAPGPRP